MDSLIYSQSVPTLSSSDLRQQNNLAEFSKFVQRRCGMDASTGQLSPLSHGSMKSVDNQQVALNSLVCLQPIAQEVLL